MIVCCVKNDMIGMRCMEQRSDEDDNSVGDELGRLRCAVVMHYTQRTHRHETQYARRPSAGPGSTAATMTT